MEIIIDTKKSIEQNASDYFDKSKKYKKKIEGIKKALEQFKKEKEELLKQKEKAVSKEEKVLEEKKAKQQRQKEKKWYEKFHWFISSEGFLCIGGKDATTNEIVVKKHTDKDDLVFHTEAPGSPFFVIKTEGRTPGDATIEETAIATACYSRAWKMGLGTAEVYWIKPDQVKKDIGLPKGSFMIHGKRNQFNVALELGIGILEDDKVMGGPVDAVTKNCKKFVIVVQGKQKKSDIAKKIAKLIDGDLDEIISALPAGDFEIKK